MLLEPGCLRRYPLLHSIRGKSLDIHPIALNEITLSHLRFVQKQHIALVEHATITIVVGIDGSVVLIVGPQYDTTHVYVAPAEFGTWIQNVAAAWLMTLLAPNALMVGLVQTLSGFPVFYLLSRPALWLISCPGHHP